MQKAFLAWRRALTLGGGVLASFVFAGSALAAGWTDLASPTTNNLNGVDCGSASTCIAVGDSGTVIYTTNKLTWSAGVSGTTETLRDVDMTSSTVGLAVGSAGTILKTTNGGATWSAMTSGTTEMLYDIFMASSSNGWAVGNDGQIRKTTDGGTTWTNVAGALSNDFRAVDATSTTVVWVGAGAGKVYRSTNGGTTWSDVSTSAGSDIVAIDALSSTSAVIGGTLNRSEKTTDSGATWTTFATITGFSSTETIVDFSFWTNSAGNATGSEGSIASTGDAATTWSADTVTFGTTPAITDSATPSVGVRYVVGEGGFLGFYDNYGPNAPTDLTTDGDTSDADYNNTTTPTLTWTAATDDEGSAIMTYQYSLDGGATWGATTSNTSHTFSALAVGSHTVTLRAVDEVDNEGDTAELDFTVDTTAPTIGSVSPITATTGTSTTFTVTASDSDSGMDNCTLYRGTTAVAVMTNSSGSTWSAAATTSTAGSYSLYATCYDNAGNSTSGTAVTLTVTGTSSADTTAPSVGSISPITATDDVALTLSATYSDSVGVSSCTLYVNGSSAGAMTLSSGTARKTYTFNSTGTATAYATCVDAAGNVGTGTLKTITISAATTTDEEDEAAAHDLIKTNCVGGEDVNDPCKAVYYYGEDGKRHAFPNEKVYFTWYEDFSDVVIVSTSYMASIPLGHNVTYHPGTKMVKFITVNTVYAVGEEGELRGVASEEVAASIWGSTWNKQIDDISDAFYGNYTFGEAIDSTSDYDPDAVEASVDSIDDIL